jgi:hypothetical protein
MENLAQITNEEIQKRYLIKLLQETEMTILNLMSDCNHFDYVAKYEDFLEYKHQILITL